MKNQITELKIIEQIIEEWIYCYPNRSLSSQKIEILEKQHDQNLIDDSRGNLSGLLPAPEWICREIELDEGTNWFWVLASCLNLIYSQKEGKSIKRYTEQFNKSSFSFLNISETHK